MNQILSKKIYSKNKKIKKYLSIQFILSLFFVILIICFIYYTYYIQNINEKYGKLLLRNYDILRLYSIPQNFKNDKNTMSIIGFISIPKINIEYTIFSNYTDELLKISPCKLYGPNPGEYGNLCIASHNYDNNKFFSNIWTLSNNDEIYIYDIYNNKYSYYVFDNYEVKNTNSSPIYVYNQNIRQLTLITCNNKNKTKTIIKAKMENI